MRNKIFKYLYKFTLNEGTDDEGHLHLCRHCLNMPPTIRMNDTLITCFDNDTLYDQ